MDEMDKIPEISDYLLDECSPEQRAEFERELAADPSLAAEVDDLNQLVKRLEALPDEAWDATVLPPLELSRSSDSEKSSTDGAHDREAKPGIFERFFGGAVSLRPAIALVSAIAVFAAGLGVGMLTGSDDSTTSLGATVRQADLSPVGSIDPAAAGSADLKKDGTVVRLKLSGLKPSGDNDFYEAWLMDPKNGFIGIGTFRVSQSGETTLNLPVPVATESFPIVDISLQPVDGKPTHSGVSVLRGTLN